MLSRHQTHESLIVRLKDSQRSHTSHNPLAAPNDQRPIHSAAYLTPTVTTTTRHHAYTHAQRAMPRSSSSSPAPVAISLSHASSSAATTTTTTVTFYTNALDEKHKLNKLQTVEFPSAKLTAEYALSLLPNIALLQPDATFSAYDNLKLAKLRLGADAAVHLTIVRWHLLGSTPTADEKKSMVERQRVVCGCDKDPSYLQCRIRAYAAIQHRGGKPDVRCTRFQKLLVSVTSSPTLLDLLLDAIENEPKAEPLDVAKHIHASYPEISAVHEIRFNQGAALEYKITRVSDKDDAERSTKQKSNDNGWVNRGMLWRIDSNRAQLPPGDGHRVHLRRPRPSTAGLTQQRRNAVRRPLLSSWRHLGSQTGRRGRLCYPTTRSLAVRRIPRLH